MKICTLIVLFLFSANALAGNGGGTMGFAPDDHNAIREVLFHDLQEGSVSFQIAIRRFDQWEIIPAQVYLDDPRFEQVLDQVQKSSIDRRWQPLPQGQ